MEFDLTFARNFWIEASNDEEEKKLRMGSDFLKYLNSLGKFAGFHVLPELSPKSL